MFRLLVVCCLTVMGVLMAWLAVSSARNQPADVVLINGAEVHNLDPARMSWMHDIRTAYGLWEGLLTMDPRTLAIVPAVAREVPVPTHGGRTYTFHLRPEARWSNGEPVTAEDFRFAWLRVLDPINAADYYGYLCLIEGARDYYKAMKDAQDRMRKGLPPRPPRPKADSSALPQTQPDGQSPAGTQAASQPAGGGDGQVLYAPDPESVAIRALDSRTLEVTLTEPVAYFPELVAFATFLPVHRASMDRFLVQPAGQPAFHDPAWLQPGNLVSNGPFMLTGWEFQHRLILTRNPHYWDAANVPSERIELRANADVNTAFLVYETGRADVLTSLPEAAGRELVARAARGQRDDLKVFPVWGTYYYRLNCKRPPLDDPRVRRALAMAVDRDAIVGHVVRNGERAQSSFVTPGITVMAPPGLQWPSDRLAGAGWRLSDDRQRVEYLPADGVTFDPVAAAALLKEAGFGPGGRPFRCDDGQPVRLMMNESPLHRPIAEAVRKMWQDHLKIEVELEVQVSGIFGQRMRSHQFEIGRSGWFTDYGDPTGFLDMFRKDDGQNDGQFDVPEYDRLLAEAAKTADPAARYALLHRAERLLVADHVGVIPIYQYVGQLMFRSDIQGIWPNPKQQIMLKHVAKKKG